MLYNLPLVANMWQGGPPLGVRGRAMKEGCITVFAAFEYLCGLIIKNRE
jgi:hypothetical protein